VGVCVCVYVCVCVCVCVCVFACEFVYKKLCASVRVCMHVCTRAPHSRSLSRFREIAGVLSLSRAHTVQQWNLHKRIHTWSSGGGVNFNFLHASQGGL